VVRFLLGISGVTSVLLALRLVVKALERDIALNNYVGPDKEGRFLPTWEWGNRDAM
jgi:hypothetical protein